MSETVNAPGLAPWEIDQAQPALARLAAAGAFRGEVLDAGCGSGDNAVLVASLGLTVVGVDVAATALARARAKAAERGLAAQFTLGDAFALDRLGRRRSATVCTHGPQLVEVVGRVTGES